MAIYTQGTRLVHTKTCPLVYLSLVWTSLWLWPVCLHPSCLLQPVCHLGPQYRPLTAYHCPSSSRCCRVVTLGQVFSPAGHESTSVVGIDPQEPPNHLESGIGIGPVPSLPEVIGIPVHCHIAYCNQGVSSRSSVAINLSVSTIISETSC
jgi:hypothetical protein